MLMILANQTMKSLRFIIMLNLKMVTLRFAKFLMEAENHPTNRLNVNIEEREVKSVAKQAGNYFNGHNEPSSIFKFYLVDPPSIPPIRLIALPGTEAFINKQKNRLSALQRVITNKLESP